MESTIKTANILIVDDKQANIDILESLLEMQGYTNIKTTSDSRLALDLFKTFHPDLILLDLMMPYLNGYEIMEQLNAFITPETYLPILVLTADISIETKQRALASGAKDFLVKPFDLIEVGLRIKNLLETRILHLKLENQNIVLEEKVRERTSELEKTNIELIAARDKAEESDKLKTSFLNNISHEIRTPFNGILGFLEMVYDEDTTPNERNEHIEIINQSADRLMSTINSIVDMSQIQANQVKLNLSKTELGRVTKEILYKFNPIANKKGLELVIHNQLPEEFDIITTDNYKLTTILSVLTDNAIKFTNTGSVELSICKNADTIEFLVKDTGIGIPKEKHEAIFERFRQGDVSLNRNYEGSGLGLAISKAYIEFLGGKIWVESEVGIGSTFYFNIPYRTKTDENNGAKNNDSFVSSENQINCLKILIAEDDKDSEKLLSMQVCKFSKEIIRVKTGTEAVEACRTHPDINLVLMDIQMPEMNGYEATRQIRKFNKEIVIIAQTAYALTGDREKAMENGCNDYISKPIKREKLMELVEKYFNK